MKIKDKGQTGGKGRTAVQILIAQMPIRVLNAYREDFEKALETEKLQIIEAFCAGYDHEGGNYDFAEEIYYEKKYGNEQDGNTETD